MQGESAATTRDVAASAYGRRWLCFDCNHEYEPRNIVLGGIERLGESIRWCPRCQSINVRTPEGRVREAVRRG